MWINAGLTKCRSNIKREKEFSKFIYLVGNDKIRKVNEPSMKIIDLIRIKSRFVQMRNTSVRKFRIDKGLVHNCIHVQIAALNVIDFKLKKK